MIGPHIRRGSRAKGGGVNRSAVRIDAARAAALIALPPAFHPLLAEKLAHEKRRRELDESQLLPENDWGPFRTAIGRRELRVQDALLKAADARGHVLCHRPNALSGLWLLIDGERVDWEFRERYYYGPPRTAQTGPDGHPPGRKQNNVAEPSGYLVLSIKAALSPKQDMHERYGHLFESRIDEILQKFEMKAAHAVAQRRQWAQRERARCECQARARRQQTLEERENERWSELCRMAAAWRDADNLRAFVNLVAARMDELNQRPVRADLWLAWARRRIDALDPSRREARTVYEAIVQNPLLRQNRDFPESAALFDGAAFDEF